MADYYVKSGAAGSADGSSWTNAYTTIKAAVEARSAGDRFFVSHQHAETQASNMNITSPGTAANPQHILCVNDGATPPTALALTATATATGGFAVTLVGSFYCYGVQFYSGSSGNAISLFLGSSGAGSSIQFYEKCQFYCPTTFASATGIQLGGNADFDVHNIIWKNCDVKFGVSGHGIINFIANLRWDGGSVLSGSAALTSLLRGGGIGRRNLMIIEGVDLSNIGTTAGILIEGTNAANVMLRNCKLPASWSGTLVQSGTITPAHRSEMWNCDNDDTQYKVWIEDYAGTIREEATLVKTGSAAAQSIKMTASANAEYPGITLRSPEISRRNTAVGSSKTVTVDILHDSATNLKDNEVWLEVQYLGTSGFPISTFISDAKTDVLATAADQTTSSATWTTSGMSNANKQKLAVTFTPQEAGYFQAVVHLALASKVIYVDPDLQVT